MKNKLPKRRNYIEAWYDPRTYEIIKYNPKTNEWSFVIENNVERWDKWYVGPESYDKHVTYGYQFIGVLKSRKI